MKNSMESTRKRHRVVKFRFRPCGRASLFAQKTIEKLSTTSDGK